MNPLIEEFAGSCRAPIIPEPMELFLEQICLDGTQVHLQQFPQFQPLFLREIRFAFQKTPVAFRQDRVLFFLFQSPCFVGPDLVDGFAEFLHDVEAVENVQRLRQFGGDHLQIWLPHVAANEFDPIGKLCIQRFEFLEKTVQGFLRTFFADPQKPSTLLVPDAVKQANGIRGNAVTGYAGLRP